MLDLSDSIDIKGADSNLDDIVSDIKVEPFDFSTLDVVSKKSGNIFEDKKRKSWNKDELARCNFEYKLHICRRSEVCFVSIWKKSIMGKSLVEIKSDDSEVEHFAKSLCPVIKETLGCNLSKGDWCICTTPKRRHKVKNFATLIAERMGEILGIPFYEDVALCHSRHRVNAEFTLNLLPKETNVIVFDDFVTTGQTLLSMKKLLQPLGKNLAWFSGIDNKL